MGDFMDEDKTKAKEVAELKKRIEYLIVTDQISDDEKLEIVQKALKIIEEDKNKR
jgi:hypothetical protein